MQLHYHRRYFKEEAHRGDGRRAGRSMDRGEGRRGGGGAKTFRRARALTFLHKLQVQRDVLKKQLETPELQAINPMIAGELKAVDMMMAEFIATFELHEEVQLVDNENDFQLESDGKDE